MDLTDVLAQHVRAHALRLDLGHQGAEDLGAGAVEDVSLAGVARGLEDLAALVHADVLTCSGVALLLTLPAGRVLVPQQVPTETDPAHAGAEGLRPRVCASLAVPLPEVGLEALLVLQATQRGAFLLLAAELAERLGPDPEVLVDQHRDLHIDATGAALVDDLARLRDVEQAVGAMVDRGLPREQAYQVLRDEARAADSSGGAGDVPGHARRFLDALRRPVGEAVVDSPDQPPHSEGG